MSWFNLLRRWIANGLPAIKVDIKPVIAPQPKPQAKVIIMPKPAITATQLMALTPAIKGQLAINIAASISKVFAFYPGIEQPTVMEDVMANILVECAEFTRFSESLNYSVEGLKLFGYRITTAERLMYGRVDGKRAANQQAIANIVYNAKWVKLGLGNKLPNDGWDLRGSGPLQATGRGIMFRFSLFINPLLKTNYTLLQLAVMMRDKMNIEMGLHFAAWFITIEKKLMDEAAANNVVAFRRGVNGGQNGLDDVRRYTERGRVAFKA